jgi:hypothetical protein
MKEPNYEEKIGYIGQFSTDFKRVIDNVTDGNRPQRGLQKAWPFADRAVSTSARPALMALPRESER